MSQLVIDIGNSRTKIAVFEGRGLVRADYIEHADKEVVLSYFDQYDIQQSILSSVNEETSAWEEILKKRTAYIRFSAETGNGIEMRYKTPGTLGLDRLAGVIGAKALFPGRNCLVIDAGTCITYDAIDKNSVYKGGSISPGLVMRLKAMHTFTGRLPLITWADFEGLEGHDTVTSMLSGVVNGTLAEVVGLIEKYQSYYPDLQVILCGGDTNFFDRRLKNSIFAHTFKTEPDLVLIGLNEVIHQQ
jgi:type III pantothenate kinase